MSLREKLRERAIEAMARGLEKSEVYEDAWQDWHAFDCEAVATAALNALCDYLTEHANEWALDVGDDPQDLSALRRIDEATRLIAVLRESANACRTEEE